MVNKTRRIPISKAKKLFNKMAKYNNTNPMDFTNRSAARHVFELHLVCLRSLPNKYKMIVIKRMSKLLRWIASLFRSQRERQRSRNQNFFTLILDPKLCYLTNGLEGFGFGNYDQFKSGFCLNPRSTDVFIVT
jgi:hypothetical protein